MSREAFELWYAVTAFDYTRDPIGSRDCGLQWKAWQACEAQHEKELAALQARVKELEDALLNQLYPSILCIPTWAEANSQARAALAHTSPDQALQRALLDARIDERINNREFPNGINRASRLEELRAKRAELGE